jgi:hypothetical protein
MEISVKILHVLDAQTYVSQKNGKTYVTNTFVGETTMGQYPKKIVFKVMSEGGERFAQMGIVVGGTYNVSFDIESREWNGRWYTDLNAWKATRLDANTNTNTTQQAPQPKPQAARQEQEPQAPNVGSDGGGNNDVPF